MKKKLGVIFGGMSSEHEVSLASARSVLEAIDRSRFEVTEIGITKEGCWVAGAGALLHLLARGDRARFPGGMVEYLDRHRGALVELAPQLAVSAGRLPEFGGNRFSLTALDAAFPVLHGALGEDGTIQGLLAVAGVAVVGCGVLASAVAMDKALTKSLLAASAIPQPRWHLLAGGDRDPDIAMIDRAVATALGGYPVFVKPANAGSSVGITKVDNTAGLDAAVRLAHDHDRRILVEEAIRGRELEIAVIGDEKVIVSPVAAEIVPARDFYDYAAKYLTNDTRIDLPANVPEHVVARMRDLAERAFRAIDGCGMARIDFFYEAGADRVLLNEINTIPGFTVISQYPALMRTAGFSYPALIDKLIDIGIRRHARERRFQP